ncbi:hypothetical protein ACGFIR_14745 [Micromonospora sp. NPDC049051]|uniref:hypothetical protein n=1 Tax=Micromonospora sp. NPDC049051 TaxID=3364264 RepID=UPI0037235007
MADQDRLAVRLLASFTATPMEPVLSYWWSRLALAPAPTIAPYGQLIQPLLGLTGQDGPDPFAATVVLLRWEDWLRYLPQRPDPMRAGVVMERRLAEFADVLALAAPNLSGPVLILVCPPSATWAKPDRAGTLAYLNAQLDTIASTLDRLHVGHVAGLAARYRPTTTNDQRADDLAHMPYQPAFFTALATVVVRAVLALSTRTRRHLLLDPLRSLYPPTAGRPVDLAWRRQLPILVGQSRRLGLLAVRPGLGTEPLIESGPELRLLRHRDALRCLGGSSDPPNEQPAAAIRRLVDRGAVDPGDAVLLDANPALCAEAAAAVPGLATVSLNGDPAQVPDAVDHLWVFDGGHLLPKGPVRTDGLALPPELLPGPTTTPTDLAELHRVVQRWRREHHLAYRAK